MIGEEMKGAPLRKDGCLFMAGAIFVDEFGGNAVSIR